MLAPSYNDVCQVRAMLKTLNLPTELVLQILDHAQYWPQHNFVTNSPRPVRATGSVRKPSHAMLCLDAGILDNPTVDLIRMGGETPKIKSLEFTVVSHDQGWTSENVRGTYNTSSWLEVSILRSVDNKTHLSVPNFVRNFLGDPSDFHKGIAGLGWFLVKRPEAVVQGPQDGEGDFAWYLQGNRVAANVDHEYCVVWTETGSEGNEGAGTGQGFVTELKDSDRVLIWARAKWPGWQCFVDSVKLTARYGS
ncbi:hypothetical protein GQ44DRAFT_770634 [Phaeosphaeriaceae sp. PMI808]|nr:hypothetical protein GQ44DRAFT_770634 [Phaeosphaeriaceae sp. PMI808]